MHTIYIYTQDGPSYKVTLDSSDDPDGWIDNHTQSSVFHNSDKCYSALVWTSNEEFDAGTKRYVFLDRIASIAIKAN